MKCTRTEEIKKKNFWQINDAKVFFSEITFYVVDLKDKNGLVKEYDLKEKNGLVKVPPVHEIKFDKDLEIAYAYTENVAIYKINFKKQDNITVQTFEDKNVKHLYSDGSYFTGPQEFGEG